MICKNLFASFLSLLFPGSIEWRIIESVRETSLEIRIRLPMSHEIYLRRIWDEIIDIGVRREETVGIPEWEEDFLDDFLDSRF